ncbi:Protein HEAT INTOLERANT 4 [Linum grandiflorum]
MKQGAKRKPATAVNEAPPANPRSARAKRQRAEPEPEPEYFEKKRNMEDLWKAVFPVGTEWDHLDSYKYNWDFSNLEEAFEEGGVLHGEKVYLFRVAEPQMLPYQEEMQIVEVPAIVAVVSPFPPSDKISIKSIQSETEEIVPMKQMKMDWVPYIPMENRGTEVLRSKSQIFIFSCTQRRTASRHMKIDRFMRFGIPYFYNPLKEDEFEQSTEVPILFPGEDKPVLCEFDWELDELEEFTDNMIKDEVLSEDQKDAFKEFVREKVREAKRANREAREARKKAKEDLSEETKTAFQKIRVYKFYPKKTDDSPDVSSVKEPYINRYYGKAHEVL